MALYIDLANRKSEASMKKPSSNPAEPHPKISFATRYLDSFSTLNAMSAMVRCEALLDDIAQAKKWMAQFETSGEWLPWFGLEVFSYYNVGFVTCLEWHARSRLVDLLRFKPSAIWTDDLKGNFSDKLLSEMVAAAVDIPGLVGASRLVSSADSYFSVFWRIFDELAIPKNEQEIGAELQPLSRNHPRVALQELFETRHLLIHEITMGEIGPWIARSNVHLADIEETGRLVLALIKLIEREIATHGPANFPNKITLEGLPVDEIDYLDEEIVRLEKAISEALHIEEDGTRASRDAWHKEISAYAQSLEASTDFIASCQIAGERYFNYKREMSIGLRKDRLQHLRRVAENIGIDQTPLEPE
jgi:hypothetical protein